MSELMYAVRISATVLVIYLCIAGTIRAVEPPTEVPALPAAHGIADVGMPPHTKLVMVLLQEEPNALSKALRAELHVEPGTLERVSKVMEAALAFDEQVQPTPSNGAHDADKAGEAARKALEKSEEELLARLPTAWSEKQEARFEQLACQLAGPMALRFKHYARRAGLSEEQRARIKDLADAYLLKSIPFYRAAFTAPLEEAANAPRRQLNALAQELDNKILVTLTAPQRTQWQTLLGKGFDWKDLK